MSLWQLPTNPWFGLAFTILGLVLSVVGIMLTVRYRRAKRPIYSTISQNLVEGLHAKIEGLEVRFPGYGQSIENLTVTKLLFWNSGWGTIKKQDVLGDDGLTIYCKPGIKILDTKALHIKNPQNKFAFSVSQDRERCSVKFAYIDQGEGVLVQVIHTGTSGGDVSLVGVIADAGPILRRRPPMARSRRRKFLRAMVPLLAVSFAIWCLSIVFLLWPSLEERANSQLRKVNVLVGSAMMVIWPIMITRTVGWPHRRVPREFSMFNLEDIA